MASMVTADLAGRLLGWLLPSQVRSSALLLVVANLVPLYGVVAWDWPLFHVMALYWAENVIAGAVTVLRMLRVHPVGGLLMGAFFCVHYGMFCYVHGIFVGGLFAPGAADAFGLEPLRRVFATEPTLQVAAALMAASHGWSFVAHLLHGAAGPQELAAIMRRPYTRMVALHVAIIAGGWAIMGLDAPLLALVVLIVIKTAIDLGLHNRANAPPAPAPAAPEPAT